MKPLIGLLVATTLVIGSGCAKQDWIDRTLVTEDVTGVWATEGASSLLQIRFTLRQQGAKVTGVMTAPPTGGTALTMSIPIEGNVTGDVFTFRDERGAYSGELTVGGDDMKGQVLGPYGKRRATFRRGSVGAESGSTPR